MQDLSLLKRLYYYYLGNIYAFAYRTDRRRFLGARISSWIKFLMLVLLVAAWLFRLGSVALILALLLALWVRLLYWRAQKAGYSKFIPDKTAVVPTAELDPLSPNQHVKVRATGLFSLIDKEEYVLLQPAEYWQVPLGDHIVMVHRTAGSYLYQFFNASTLQEVQHGWLVFGSEPLKTLAITFGARWGPAFTEYGQLYYTGGNGDKTPAQKLTIYFTLANEAEHRAVWHTIVQDARRVRTSSP
jgi:hypothetical protein